MESCTYFKTDSCLNIRFVGKLSKSTSQGNPEEKEAYKQKRISK
jgi:hypothetical protein